MYPKAEQSRKLHISVLQIDATPTVFATESTSAARADAALRSPFSFSSAAMRSSIVGSGFTYTKKPPVRMA